ncbi:hypothetical protein [Actinoplanes sp. NPDC020271]|uniref:hypothetical protein n=1 Tax=Actinoplanes sp. NPDC020271 TaxID=3363896 RepID=UPI0037953670
MVRALGRELQPSGLDTREIDRAAGNKTCRILPTARVIGVSMDFLAARAAEADLGPVTARGMSQNARLQGETYDRNMLTTGIPIGQALASDGWIDGPDLQIVNIADHFTRPSKRRARDEAEEAQQQAQWRAFHRRRARYTTKEAAEALARTDTPTLLLRGVVETTPFAGTLRRSHGEFDCALVLPPGLVTARAIRAAGRAMPHGMITFGDAKSWRRRGRLDDGDKRAAVALQVALYGEAAKLAWGDRLAAAVGPVGLVVNPPASGGLSIAKLTVLDLSEMTAALHQIRERADAAVRAVDAGLAPDVAAGARLSKRDPAANRAAVKALLRFGDWNASCLQACPMAQACRRHVEDTGQVTRIGPAAAQAAPVTSIDRLAQLREGAAPTVAEDDVAEQIRRARDLLGPPVALPWQRPAGGQGRVAA